MINGGFIVRMENALRLYRLAYDEKYSVLCSDERPCFLFGDVIKGLEHITSSTIFFDTDLIRLCITFV